MAGFDEAMSEAQEWIEAILGEPFEAGFAASLQNGVLLCRLANTIKPKAIASYKSMPANPNQKMDNVGQFLRTIRGWGMKEFELFGTADLCEQKNIKSVVTCLHALGRLMQSGEFEKLDLPKLGNKVQEKRVRGGGRWIPAAAPRRAHAPYPPLPPPPSPPLPSPPQTTPGAHVQRGAARRGPRVRVRAQSRQQHDGANRLQKCALGARL
jgi:hypothetical protein